MHPGSRSPRRLSPVTWTLATLALALVGLLGVQSHGLDTRRARPAQATAMPGMHVALQPYGGRHQILTLARHALVVHARFGVEVTILAPRPLPAQSVDDDRHQVDAMQILDDLYVSRPSGITHSVGVVSEDLFADDWEFLYGYGQAPGNVAVYSSARTALDDRSEKVLVHELGHTLGLEHCPTPHCLMSTVESAGGLERMSRFFCRECEGRLGAAAAEPIAPADGLERGDGLYARGEFDRAYVRYVTELLQRPTDPTRLNRVGVAAAELGGGSVAERAYKTAILLDPDYALPYYNYGLLYAAVNPSRSAALLDMGFERDTDQVEALGYLGTVYAEVLGDEHRALAYFQAYVREGGRSANVLVRYRRLMRPSVFDFGEGEVAVFEAASTGFLARLRWRWLQFRWAVASAVERSVDAETRHASR